MKMMETRCDSAGGWLRRLVQRLELEIWSRGPFSGHARLLAAMSRLIAWHGARCV